MSLVFYCDIRYIVWEWEVLNFTKSSKEMKKMSINSPDQPRPNKQKYVANNGSTETKTPVKVSTSGSIFFRPNWYVLLNKNT